MINKLLKFTSLLFTIILIAIIAIIYDSQNYPEIEYDEIVEEEPPIIREDITFILGEDVGHDNPFYTKAAEFYRTDTNNQTEYYVTHCRSLLEVMDYLQKYPPLNHQPWGTVNLVSHGNQWLGMSIRVIPDGKRVSFKNIKDAMDEGIIEELPDSILDDSSKIYIHACGVGHNKDLLEILSVAFGGIENKPKVIASKMFEYYTSFKNEHGKEVFEKYLSKVWYVHYKMGYAPGDQTILKKFIYKYPTDSIDWEKALSLQKPTYIGEHYSYSFDLPVKLVVPYPDSNSLPDISTRKKQMEWIKLQTDLVNMIDEAELTVYDFNWWFRQILIKTDTGELKPAIWLKGYCTYLCVLQPMVDSSIKDRSVPFCPSIYDTQYFSIQ